MPGRGDPSAALRMTGLELSLLCRSGHFTLSFRPLYSVVPTTLLCRSGHFTLSFRPLYSVIPTTLLCHPDHFTLSSRPQWRDLLQLAECFWDWVVFSDAGAGARRSFGCAQDDRVGVVITLSFRALYSVDSGHFTLSSRPLYSVIPTAVEGSPAIGRMLLGLGSFFRRRCRGEEILRLRSG